MLALAARAHLSRGSTCPKRGERRALGLLRERLRARRPRARRARRHPRRPADQGRRQSAAPVEPWRDRCVRAGIGARALGSGPLGRRAAAARQPARRARARRRPQARAGQAFESAWSGRAARLRAERWRRLARAHRSVHVADAARAACGPARALSRAHAGTSTRRCTTARPTPVRARPSGSRCRPCSISTARATIVALAADPFSDGPGAVRHATDWVTRREADASQRRRTAAPLRGARSTPGLFGARADVRLAAAPRSDRRTGAAPRCADRRRRRSRRRRGVERSGSGFRDGAGRCAARRWRRQPDRPGRRTRRRESHAAVHAIQHRLGAVGRTLHLIAPLAMASARRIARRTGRGDRRRRGRHAARPRRQPGLRRAGGARRRERASRRCSTTIHAGLYRDETARASVLAPAAVARLRALGRRARARRQRDADPAGDRAALRQPLDASSCSRSSRGDDERDGHRLVQRHWRAARRRRRLRRVLGDEPASRRRRRQRRRAACADAARPRSPLPVGTARPLVARDCAPPPARAHAPRAAHRRRVRRQPCRRLRCRSVGRTTAASRTTPGCRSCRARTAS